MSMHKLIYLSSNQKRKKINKKVSILIIIYYLGANKEVRDVVAGD
jgi:hypothetical protein